MTIGTLHQISRKLYPRTLNTLVKVGLIRCELRGMPARRCFYIVEDTELIESLIADGEAAIAKIKPAAAKRFVCKSQYAADENNAAAQTAKTHENSNSNAVSTERQNKFRQKVRACSDKRAELLFNNKTKDNKPKGNSIYQSYSNQGILLEEFNRYDMTENNTQKQREEYLQLLKENICYDTLCELNKTAKGRIDELLSIMTDTVCTSKQYVRINGEDMPQQLVKSRFLKLTDEHIDYVLTAMQRNTSNVRNIRAYLLTALYNAPTTMSSYYQAWFNCTNHGMCEKNNLAKVQVLC